MTMVKELRCPRCGWKFLFVDIDEPFRYNSEYFCGDCGYKIPASLAYWRPLRMSDIFGDDNDASMD